MMDKLMKMMEMAGECEPMDNEEKAIRLKVAKKLRSDASKDSEDGLKKLVVAAKSDKGLEEGMDKAKELLQMKDKMMPESEEESMEEESMEDESSEPEMSEEDLDKKIQELMAMKQKMKK